MHPVPVPVYSLSPHQIVDATFLQHGQTTGPDLQKLRDPLLKLLPALAELETHMNLFMLASVKLTANENAWYILWFWFCRTSGLRNRIPSLFEPYNLNHVSVFSVTHRLSCLPYSYVP
jgi:hypothetical protein